MRIKQWYYAQKHERYIDSLPLSMRIQHCIPEVIVCEEDYVYYCELGRQLSKGVHHRKATKIAERHLKDWNTHYVPE